MAADLLTFLHARYDEDEAAARSAGGIVEWHVPARRAVMAEGFGEAEPYDASLRTLLERDDSLMPFGCVAVTDHDADARFIARFDPARVVAEVEAKRALLRMYEQPERSDALPESVNRFTASTQRQVLDAVFRRLALPYAGHPDYREEWRP
ncbi:hypothetical protein IHE55_07365 [Streptomyces pactum]|uniref:Uncharacterized protein n=1 Tax=Streptomyces pactum TaxID=68249 RepID=A0ABS0NHH1_9ACTN|nr:DUF6221 family protein [Streptomyces pactum]MBH5334630.1 hypothetical protein [Streptomyces pactum]